MNVKAPQSLVHWGWRSLVPRLSAWPRWRRLRRAGLRVMAEAGAFRRGVVAGRRGVAATDIATLRSSIERLPPLPAPRSEAEAIWCAYRQGFRSDVMLRNPRRFLRWRVLRPMYKRDAPYLEHQLAYLRAHRDWPLRWQPAVQESAIGDPRPYFEYRSSSGNLLNQAYHVCRFEDVTGARLRDSEFILEFGGGYGALCRLVYALGFRGTYAIYDFPEFSALQDFYLRAHGLPTAAGPRLDGSQSRIVTLSTLDELDELLERRLPGRAACVALWSLNETPRALRDAFMTRVVAFDMFVFGYHPRFGDVDNTAWFRAIRSRLDGITWHDVPLPRNDESARHLFGVRRNS
jgi:hypothetical protein